MSFMKSDTIRQALARLRSGRTTGSGLGGAASSSAAQLVQETLARHGLAEAPRPAANSTDGAAARDTTPPQNPSGLGGTMSEMMSGLMSGARSGGLSGTFAGLMPDSGTPAGPRATHAEAAGSRDYVLHVPDSIGDAPPAGLVLMLHGCTQTPEDFATGTGMNALADRHRLIVVYPAQARGANAQSCWNWFSKGDQQRERGEPSILAGMARAIAAEHDVPEGKIFVAGLSAGAAMSVILGETYPEIFAAVGAHSGLPYGAARDVPQAFAAMRGDTGNRAAKPGRAVPTIVFHGDADGTVALANGALIEADILDAAKGTQIQTVTEGFAGGRKFRQVVTQGAKGTALAEHWQIAGLGHAWSGGNGAGSYTDPAGPDASAEMVRFFLSVPTAQG